MPEHKAQWPDGDFVHRDNNLKFKVSGVDVVIGIA